MRGADGECRGSETQAITSVGLRVEQDLSSMINAPIVLTGSAAWQHTFGDVDAETMIRFASGVSTFTVNGAALDRDQAALSAVSAPR
ncbi:MAG: autotransporter outer membrane beta-barrel domain-containing protein [Breoghania sp.]|nr:autotransporter outer membrane beta-barrel domain-containing protein [Breoghania sp.]MDJ0932717.1 autotransporter outer membrane beta-barrel domain-containing protein [Breoghania sp.]